MRAIVLLAPAALLWAHALWAQSGQARFIETVAGAARFDNRPAREAALVQPQAAWVHPSGDLYIADGNFLVWRVRQGIATIVAGGGDRVDDSTAIPARQADLDYPAGIVGTAAGEIYVADRRHHRIRRLNPNGTMVTVVGRGVAGYSGDGGAATAAELNEPAALAIDGEGRVYIADSRNGAVRRYDPRTARIETVAGGPAARLGSIGGIAVDPAGNLFVADTETATIRRIAPDGRSAVYAGNGRAGFSGDGGPATAASLSPSWGLAADSRGNLYIADYDNARIRVVGPSGVITTYAGQSARRNRGADAIPASQLFFDGPQGLAVDETGALYVCEDGADLVRRIDPISGIVNTIAGTRQPTDGLPALEATIARPADIAYDPQGNLYIADIGRYRVRRVDRATGRISTFAGDGIEAGAPGATAASLGGDFTISLDRRGGLLIADTATRSIRRVDLTTREASVVADFSAQGISPEQVVADAAGTIYFTDTERNSVYRYRGGVLTPLAGPEVLRNPGDIELDRSNGLLVCDRGNHMVRRIDLATGAVTRFAGDGVDESDLDGRLAVEASLRTPAGLAIAADGTVYISDSDAHQIRAVGPDGIIRTVAGSGLDGFAGDGGPAALALFDTPLGLDIENGELYVADYYNYRIRRIFPRAVENRLSVSPARFRFRAPAGGEPPTGQLAILQSSLHGAHLPWSAEARAPWIQLDDAAGTTPGLVLVTVSAATFAPGVYESAVVFRTPGGRDIEVPVELTVDPPNVASAVSLSPGALLFSLQPGGTESQTIAVRSAGANALEWSIAPLLEAPWLRFSPASGRTPSTVTVTADARDLAPGAHLGAAYFTTSFGSTSAGVSLFGAVALVRPPQPVLALDRQLLAFESVEGATSAPSQSFAIFNAGGAPLDWELVTPPEAGWLEASPRRGRVEPGIAPGAVQLTAHPSGLRNGIYAATLLLRAAGALDAPQIVSVRLRVSPAGTAGKPVFSRAALVFRGEPSQSFELSTTGGRLAYTTSIQTEADRAWLSVSPAAGVLASSSQRERVRVQANAAGLAPGIHRAAIDYHFSDGSSRQVAVLLIAGGSAPAARAAACSPSAQALIVPALPNNFAVSVGWPVPLQVEVYDDCGQPVRDATVVASFSTGEAPRSLASLRNGSYTATWTPASAAAVTVSFRSRTASLPEAELKLSGGAARDAGTAPVLTAVRNAASRRDAGVVAPGTLLSLSGASFTADATVLVNGSPARIVSTAADEIQAVAPDGLAGSGRASVIVSAHGLLTAPEVMAVVEADPGLFAPDTAVAAAPGDVVTFGATGLAAKPVTARFDSIEAAVLGVDPRPGAPGVYDVRIRVPNAPSGTRQVTIAQGGPPSNPVPVEVR